MNINFTLIVQAFNFFVAYLILRLFLFKPAVAVIEQERIEENGVRVSIHQGARLNAELLSENKMQWQINQKEFFAHTPQVTDPDLYVFKGLAPALKISELNIRETEKLQNEIAQHILKKVEQMHE